MILANFLSEWAAWLSELWEINIDRWIAAGWIVTAVLTIIACIGMIIRILSSNKGLEP